MQSKLKASLFALLAVPLVLEADEKSAKLNAEPLSRYQAMIDHSPFAVATEMAPPPSVAENVGFTKDLVLTGAVRLNGGEYITVESKDHNERFSLKTGEAYNEISLASIAWSDAAGKTKATLKKGTEFGTIGFDETAVRTGPVAASPGNGGPDGPNGSPSANPSGNTQPPQPPGMVAQPQPTKGPGPNPMIIRRVRPVPVAPASR